MNVQKTHYIGDLRQLINRHYRAEELRHLCAELGLDYDGLPGETKLLKINTLVWQYAQSDRLADLLLGLRSQHPDLQWPETPVNKSARNGHKANGSKSGPKSVLRSHLDELKRQLLDQDLKTSPPGSEARKSASARTLETLDRLDGKLKRDLLRFLWESGLIAKGDPVIELRGANLSHIDLSWIDLSEANLSFTNLNGTDLGLADLHETDLSGANLRGTHLRTYLSGAELVGADLRESNLSGAKLMGAKLTGANLRIANLSRADLTGANLMGADLRLANLQGANLSRANLLWANLSQTNLREANFDGAELSAADLTEAEVSFRQIEQAVGYENALLPESRQFKRSNGQPVSTVEDQDQVKAEEQAQDNPAEPSEARAAHRSRIPSGRLGSRVQRLFRRRT